MKQVSKHDIEQPSATLAVRVLVVRSSLLFHSGDGWTTVCFVFVGARPGVRAPWSHACFSWTTCERTQLPRLTYPATCIQTSFICPCGQSGRVNEVSVSIYYLLLYFSSYHLILQMEKQTWGESLHPHQEKGCVVAGAATGRGLDLRARGSLGAGSSPFCEMCLVPQTCSPPHPYDTLS